MLGEVGRSLGRAVPRDIVRRGAERHPHRCQPPCDQARILEVADAHGEVEALLDKIEITIVEGDIHQHFRAQPEIVGDGRGEVPNAEGLRRRDPQQPARRRLQVGCEPVRFLDIRKDLPHALVIGLAHFRRTDAAGGAVEQLRAKLLLERVHVPAHHRRRQAEMPRRRGEAAALHHFDKDGHAGKPVHRTPRRSPDAPAPSEPLLIAGAKQRPIVPIRDDPRDRSWHRAVIQQRERGAQETAYVDTVVEPLAL